MHILLTDLLTCPRCGPEFGLIVLADRIEDRRVREGRLGCANCRESYPVRSGVADLRRPGDPDALAPEGAADPDRAFRAAALSGVSHGPGTVLVAGAPAAVVEEIDRLLPNARVVGAGRPQSGAAGDWMMLGEVLPFRDASLRAVVLLDGGVERLSEAARVLAPGGRIVVDPAPPGTAERLPECGLSLLLDQERVVVASLPGPG